MEQKGQTSEIVMYQPDETIRLEGCRWIMR